MGLFFEVSNSMLLVLFRRISPDNGLSEGFSNAVSALNVANPLEQEIAGFWYQRQTVSLFYNLRRRYFSHAVATL